MDERIEPRPKHISVTVREGPKLEGRAGQVKEIVQDVFSCCDTDSTCQHRRSLADRRLSTPSWSRISDIPSEILPFALEKTVGGDMEKDDILRHSHDDKLDDFQRAVNCLQSGHKAFAPQNFDHFVKENDGRAMSEVWPLLEQELRKPDVPLQFHDIAARKFPFAIIELYKKENVDAVRLILDLIFDLIPSATDVETSQVWVLCLERLIQSCNSGDVQRDIYPSVVSRLASNPSVSTNGKVGACVLLRKLAARFGSDVIQKKLFPLMDTLSKDREPKVRQAAVASLPEMIHRIKNKEPALKLINSVSHDSERDVRSATVYTIVQSITLMNPKDERNQAYLASVMQTLKPLVKDAYVKRNIDLLVAYSECMGRVSLAFAAAEVMKPRDTLWFLDSFLQLSRYELKTVDHCSDNIEDDSIPIGFANYKANMEFTRRHSILESLISTKQPGEKASQAAIQTAKAITALRTQAEGKQMSVPYGGGGAPHPVCMKVFGPDFERAYECRMNAAKEFYEFMLFAKPFVDFRHGLHPLMVDLMHDMRPEVRAAMAQKILPIMEFLGPEAGLLHGELVYCLTDDDVDVIQAIVPHMSRILKCLVIANIISPERVTPKLVEIGGALLFCEERLNQTTYYVVHQTLLDQFSSLPYSLPGDYIYSNFIPALLHRLRHMRQIPCRMAAGNALIAFLRHCRRANQREELRRRIKEGFAHGRSVQDRMLFLYMVKKVMEQFSKKYFREHFFEDVLLLANDPVGNVRRKVMELVPELRGAVVDQPLQRKLEETFQKARKSEVDRDVMDVIEETMTKLNTTATTTKQLPSKEDGKKPKTGAAAVEPPKVKTSGGKKDEDDAAKELEEAYIESLELETSQETSVKEKRRSFYGTKKRASLDVGGTGTTPASPLHPSKK